MHGLNAKHTSSAEEKVKVASAKTLKSNQESLGWVYDDDDAKILEVMLL